ncbi:hypothetical protein SLEP1_g6741 [Rubroshorea leprosula]|uniref:Uncharacterized protein n=1 Tax=Rubroshorea leprosula TaxID=152421 RepID=A0AAV5HW66_9ROSI|nr:hypothetical protein SLEP1_g6741 [Rubroshorea leprosula]
MVSSILYYHVYGSPLPAAWCCFTSWIVNSSFYGSSTKISGF